MNCSLVVSGNDIVLQRWALGGNDSKHDDYGSGKYCIHGVAEWAIKYFRMPYRLDLSISRSGAHGFSSPYENRKMDLKHQHSSKHSTLCVLLCADAAALQTTISPALNVFMYIHSSRRLRKLFAFELPCAQALPAAVRPPFQNLSLHSLH